MAKRFRILLIAVVVAVAFVSAMASGQQDTRARITAASSVLLGPPGPATTQATIVSALAELLALLAFNYDLGVEENAKAMSEALQTVSTIEVTRAVRKTEMDGTKVKRGQNIAIRNDKELISAGDDIIEVVLDALQKSGAQEAELVTVYWGVEAETATTEAIAARIRERYGIEVELVDGGQPHYDYIISVE